MGLRLALQPRPLCPAFYAISVRRLGTLPAASFRFRLTADTLAVQLTLPTTKRVVDFHHQAIAHGGRTTIRERHRHNGAFHVCLYICDIMCRSPRNDRVGGNEFPPTTPPYVPFGIRRFGSSPRLSQRFCAFALRLPSFCLIYVSATPHIEHTHYIF